jgi:hypothetical protein
MDGRCVRDAGDATFRKVTRTFRGRFADVLQVSHRALHARITHISQRFARFADVSRVSRQLLHTFRARFAVFRGRFASVAPRCLNAASML